MESGRRSVVGLFCGHSQSVKVAGCFRRRTPSLMFGTILNATLPEERVLLCYATLCGVYLPSVVYNFVVIAQ